MLASAIRTASSAVVGSGGSGGGGARSPGACPITWRYVASLAGSIALSGRELRAAELQARFGLGDVGAGQVADLEAVRVASRLV